MSPHIPTRLHIVCDFHQWVGEPNKTSIYNRRMDNLVRNVWKTFSWFWNYAKVVGPYFVANEPLFTSSLNYEVWNLKSEQAQLTRTPNRYKVKKPPSLQEGPNFQAILIAFLIDVSNNMLHEITIYMNHVLIRLQLVAPEHSTCKLVWNLPSSHKSHKVSNKLEQDSRIVPSCWQVNQNAKGILDTPTIFECVKANQYTRWLAWRQYSITNFQLLLRAAKDVIFIMFRAIPSPKTIEVCVLQHSKTLSPFTDIV